MASNTAEDAALEAPSSSEDNPRELGGTASVTEEGGNEPADATVPAADGKTPEIHSKSNGKAGSSEDGEGSAEDGEVDSQSGEDAEAPPLPDEAIPPLPSEAPPALVEQDDGWAPIWEDSAQAFYFYNRFTGATQWDNPRVPETSASGVETPTPPATRPAGGYDPAIHGDYDPTAWYAQSWEPEAPTQNLDPAAAYAASAAFNRFTGRFQNAELTPENFNDENKSRRQMNAFFNVDAAANSHDGRSLKEERSGKKLTKAELKKFKEKRKAKKEEKRKAWLRD